MKLILLLCISSICFAIKGQLFMPFTNFKKTGFSLEIGGSMDGNNGESIHALATTTGTFRLGSYFAVRTSLHYGTKSKFENLSTNFSLRNLTEVSFHPFGVNSKEGFAKFGVYAGIDDGIRNFKFEGLSQKDMETGATIQQYTGTGYDDYKANYSSTVFQFAIPTYRIGISAFMFSPSKREGKKDKSEGGAAANIYIFYAFAPTLQNAVIKGTESSYNIDVPFEYSITNGLSRKTNGIAFGIQLLTHSYFGFKMEIGSRPTIYKSDSFGHKPKGFEKAAYFNLGFNLRLI